MGKLLGRNANASQLQDSSMSPPGERVWDCRWQRFGFQTLR